jgi:hypothetical protein
VDIASSEDIASFLIANMVSIAESEKSHLGIKVVEFPGKCMKLGRSRDKDASTCSPQALHPCAKESGCKIRTE